MDLDNQRASLFEQPVGGINSRHKPQRILSVAGALSGAGQKLRQVEGLAFTRQRFGVRSRPVGTAFECRARRQHKPNAPITRLARLSQPERCFDFFRG